HARHGHELPDDGFELAIVIERELEVDLRMRPADAVQFERRDVGAVIGEDLREPGQQAGLIGSRDNQCVGRHGEMMIRQRTFPSTVTGRLAAPEASGVMQQPAARRPRQLLLAFLCTVAAGCGNAGAPAYEGPTATAVTVATAQIRELRDVANAPGVIVPAAVADLTVYAPEMAEIVDLPVQVDQPVEAGDVLVQFDIASLNQELAAAELGEIEAQARLDRARTELSRQTDLFERGITSRTAHDAARLEHSAAETALTLARNRLEAVRAGQDRAVVRAPF